MTPFQEHLIACLIEECAEVQQACTKIQRFGGQGHYDNGESNLDALYNELQDLLAVIDLCRTGGIILLGNNGQMINAKKGKILYYWNKIRENNDNISRANND